MKLKFILLSALTLFVSVVSGCVAKPEETQEKTDDVVRILAIGNSFSEDALDSYFYGVCNAAGKKVITGNMIIGGCSIERHYLNARTDSADYRFRRIGLNGKKISVDKVRPTEAIGSDDWDYVSFQQASHFSGKYDTYKDLGALIAFVDSLTPDKTKFMWHQTWAYAPDSQHKAFPDYGSDQSVMYDSIMSASRRAVAGNKEISIIIPSGTAIQYARDMSGNPDLTRDGYHLDFVIGRYIAACAWFEAIFGESVVGNSYIPEGLSPEQARIAQEAAHAACLDPFGEKRGQVEITVHEISEKC